MLYILEAQFLLTVLLCENFHLIARGENICIEGEYNYSEHLANLFFTRLFAPRNMNIIILIFGLRGVAYYELLALFLRFRYILLRNMVAFLSESVLYSSMTNADNK